MRLPTSTPDSDLIRKIPYLRDKLLWNMVEEQVFVFSAGVISIPWNRQTSSVQPFLHTPEINSGFVSMWVGRDTNLVDLDTGPSPLNPAIGLINSPLVVRRSRKSMVLQLGCPNQDDVPIQFQANASSSCSRLLSVCIYLILLICPVPPRTKPWSHHPPRGKKRSILLRHLDNQDTIDRPSIQS